MSGYGASSSFGADLLEQRSQSLCVDSVEEQSVVRLQSFFANGNRIADLELLGRKREREETFIPELGYRYGYFIVWGVMISTAVGMLVYFKRKGWL